MVHLKFMYLFSIFSFGYCSNLDLLIETVDGKVQGYENKTQDLNKIYYAFRGIPFAKPPVGSLRFTDPVPPEKWTNTLDGKREGPSCTPIGGQGSEDCLYLNVYTPKISTNLLPVMVWVYGGYFLQGSSNFTEFGPDYLLEKDVVFVSFNYRLGVFGFLSTEDKAAVGNYGLKDQILALKWVQNNIQKFGGDPNQVTLFGQSAGSVSVSYLVQTPAAKGLFQRAILQSGTNLVPWSLAQFPRISAFALARQLGILTKNSSKLIESLRKVDMLALQKVSTSQLFFQTVVTNFLDGFVWAPSYNPKNELVANNTHQLLSEGKFNQVPLMVGFNSLESVAFQNIIDFFRLYTLSYDIFPSNLCPKDMNANLTSKLLCGVKIKGKYFNYGSVFLKTQNLYKFAADDLFVRPIHEYVKQVSKYVPTYYYRFSYEGLLGNPSRGNLSVTGVGHSEELFYLFRKSDTIQNPSNEDLIIRQRLVEMWTNFAKYGDPTPSQSKLSKIWPKSEPKQPQYLNIDEELSNKRFFERDFIQFWDKLYETYGNPPYSTY